MRRRLGLALALAAACSTIKLDDLVRCNKDSDCPTDHLCNGGECYPNTLPDPPGQVGLDVTFESLEGVFRVELAGSDKIVERILNQYPTRFRVLLHNGPKPDEPNELQVPGARDRIDITVAESYQQGEEDQDVFVPASLSLEQPSRLRRNPVVGEGTYVPYDAAGKEILGANVEIPWARYDPADADLPLVLTIRGHDGMMGNDIIVRAPVHRQLVRKELGLASTQAFALDTRRECYRKLVGTIVVGDGVPLTSIVNVEFLHARSRPQPGKSVCDPSTAVQAVCEPSTIAVAGEGSNELPECISANDCPAPYGCYADGSVRRCGCDSDSECLTGQICELDSHRCALDLTGRTATNAVANKPNEDKFDAWIYTYCDDDIEADREMAFVLRTTPVGQDDNNAMTPLPLSRLPLLSFDVAVDIPASNTNTLKLPGNLCFPDWEAPIPLALDFNHEPREVFRDDMNRPWTCCTTDCLAMKQSDDPPTAPTSCPLTGFITARTLYVQDSDHKKDFNCLALTAADPEVPDAQWIDSGRVPLGACVASGGTPIPCTIPLSAGALDEPPRTYELRLEPPVGSIVRSTTYAAEVGAGATSLPPPGSLEYRVLLRGNVDLVVDPALKDEVCADLTKCLVRAEVLAERIRLPDEDPAAAIGPHFYTTRTIEGSDTGEFVLPVNPGVYLLTALPAISSPGGPAKISVVDLRIGSDLVDTSGKIPTAVLDAPLLLPQLGQFVIFELADFDFASVATPFDLGSWTGLEFEGRELDLNDTATCYGDPGRACSIRRLRAGNSGLALTQEQFVKFVTRAAP